MEYGLYEKVLDMTTKNKIDKENHSKIRSIDNNEIPGVISTAYKKLIYEMILNLKSNKERIDFINQINKSIGLEEFYIKEAKYKELLLLHNDEDKFNELNEFRPRTSIANSSLFTGNSELTLESELRREIRTADRIDFLISFIKYSGLRLIYDDLVEFTKKNKLRVITTSYMGASDYKAILELSKLPNTEVKISYDTKRTRLHAKAYHFKRETGFSTAYIGSSNLSNPALSNGLEWNLKVSEYTSKDVINSLSKTFESYWNDNEFAKFEPRNEKNRMELKRSLSLKGKDDRGYIFFDLRPYSHQKEILEDLNLEREEYGSFKNLVIAATGGTCHNSDGCSLCY